MHSPRRDLLESSGPCRCENPKRAALCFPCGNTDGKDGDRRGPMETLGRRRAGDTSPGPQSAGEEIGRRLGQGFCRRALEGRNPREHPASAVLNPRAIARDSWAVKTQKLRPAVPAHCFGNVMIGGRKSRWVYPCGNIRDADQEEKAPKGESQERGRCEKKPARDRREKTVKRVNKP
jgi:hypothetical protein